MAKATQTTKTTTSFSYKVTIAPKSSAKSGSDGSSGSGMVTCHMCGVGKVPASWYNGGKKK